MKSNLKQFVEKFVDKTNKTSFPHLYIVDKQTGPYRKIQDAIDAAESNSIIKVSEGFYEENLIIRKPIKIQPKSYDGTQKIGVVLLINNGIAITVSLPQIDNQCTISGIKVSHSGNSQNYIKQELMEHQHIINIFQSQAIQIAQLQHQYINRVSFNKIQNTILFIEKGSVKLNGCILSLSYLVKSCQNSIPAVCIQKQGTLFLQNSEIKGHPDKQTIGIMCKLGSIYLQNSIISDHKEGGALIWGVGNNNSRIIKSTFINNSIGVHIVGEQFSIKIYSNNICNNQTAIKIGIGSSPDISRNNICQNINGIQINSAFPLIYLNVIQKNEQNGIVCRSYKKFLCRAQIKKNIGIVGNKKCGILIQGQKNKSKIIQNHLIAFNGESGIKVSKQAFPILILNKIYKNIKQGILIQEKSNAIIERNQITHNIDSNVSLGGQNSHHTILIQNLINYSPGYGIIAIQSGRCKILRNDICFNNDGICLLNSRAEIRRNFISQNLNNGIICEEISRAKLIQNFVTRNHSIGTFLRDQCGATNFIMHSNILISNQIDMGLQQENQKLIGEAKFSNTIQSQIHYPDKIGCQLI